MTRRHAIGMMGGALWLIGICAAFETWALATIKTPIATATLIAMLVVVTALMAIGIGSIRAVLRLPGKVPPRTERERRMGRQFAWVVGLEVVAFMVVNALLAATHRIVLIPAFDVIIVGIHFFPLAQLFGVRRYYPMAVLFCAIPALTLLAVPETLRLGQAQMWWVLPTLGCGLVGIVTAVGSLREVWRCLDHPSVYFR
jgi:hypothetical protein